MLAAAAAIWAVRLAAAVPIAMGGPSDLAARCRLFARNGQAVPADARRGTDVGIRTSLPRAASVALDCDSYLGSLFASTVMKSGAADRSPYRKEHLSALLGSANPLYTWCSIRGSNGGRGWTFRF